MDGRFQDGWLHVIWKWNKSINYFVLGNMGLGWGGWGKVKVNNGEGGGLVGMGCGGGQGLWCVLSIGCA